MNREETDIPGIGHIRGAYVGTCDLIWGSSCIYRGENVLIREHLCEGEKCESALCENS